MVTLAMEKNSQRLKVFCRYLNNCHMTCLNVFVFLFLVLLQVFNVYTSSVRVQIKDLKSDYNPGQAFVVPRGMLLQYTMSLQ